ERFRVAQSLRLSNAYRIGRVRRVCSVSVRRYGWPSADTEQTKLASRASHGTDSLVEKKYMRTERSFTRARRLEKISAHELGRPRARLGNPNTGIPEVVVQPIYDIYAVAPATAMGALTLFQVTQGQTFNFNGVTAFTKGPGHPTLLQPGLLEPFFTF